MITLNRKNENPFYKLENCLSLFQGCVSETNLNLAYDEVAGDKEKEEMFYCLLFSIGDVTNRHHNIFGKNNVDNGGQGNRENFYIILNWMIEYHFEDFKKFLWVGLFNEYSCFDQLFRSRVETVSPTCRAVVRVYDMFANPDYCDELALYVKSIINGNNPFNKMLVAKFLTPPKFRKGQNVVTIEVMKHKANFLKLLSNIMGWKYEYLGTYARFDGYRAWRRDYNSNLESVLFSSGKIKEFSKDQFIDWINKLPAAARGRVKSKLFKSGKLDDLRDWFDEWESKKEVAQAQQRILENKIKNGTATEEEINQLEQVKKDAKVNTGAFNFSSLYQSILNNSIDPLALESFVNKVNLPFNFLTIIDESGSMSGGPFNFATFLASVLLAKNPDDKARNLLGMFATHGRFVTEMDYKKYCKYGRWGEEATSEPRPFIDPELSFYDNFHNIHKFLKYIFKGGCTDLSSMVDEIHRVSEYVPEIKDALANYPVWCIISDGDLNSQSDAKESMLEFQSKCRQYLGFVPFIVIIEVCNFNNYSINHFADLDQVAYIPGQPELIEQMLTNFQDMDVFDVYLPLLTIWRSNRYAPVRQII